MENITNFKAVSWVIILVVLFVIPLSSKAQNPTIDSLKNLSKIAKSGTEKIDLNNEIISKLNEVNLDSAISLGNKTIIDARKAGYIKGEVNALRNTSTSLLMKGDFSTAKKNLNSAAELLLNDNDSSLLAVLFGTYGMMYGMQSMYDSANVYFQKALTVAEIIGDSENIGRYYGNLAIGYQMQGNYPEALSYQQKSLRYAEEGNNINSQAYVTLNMGNTYVNMRDYSRGEKALLRAVDLAKQAGIKNVEVYSYTNLASLYTDLEDWEQTYDYAMKAVEIARELGDIPIEAASYSKAARAKANLNQYDEAKLLIRKGMANAESSGQPIIICQLNNALGFTLMREGNYREAIQYYEKCLGTIKDTDSFDLSLSALYSELATCYENVGEYEKALSSYKNYSAILDSVRSKENIQKFTEQTMNFEFEKKQALASAEQDIKDAEAERIKNQQYFRMILLGVILLTVGLIAFLQYRGKQEKQKANLSLQRQKLKVENTLSILKSTQSQLIQSEKMASLGELTAGIAHEIQNPLNFVNNFSEVSEELLDEMNEELEKGDLEGAKSIGKDLKENLSKIGHHGKRAGSIVKGMLEHSRANKGEKAPTDVNALTDEFVRLSYHGLRAKDKSFNADFILKLDPNLPKVNVVASEIGRVILNLVNNAFYAVNEKAKSENLASEYTPMINVSTSQIPPEAGKEGYVEIFVQDNGNGIPDSIKEKIFQPFFTTKPTGSGTGLGLSLSYDIVKAHGGELKVKSIEGEGSKFSIQLPLV